MMISERSARLSDAMENCDYEAAMSAIDEYVAAFEAAPKHLEEVEEARNLMEWALRAARFAKRRMAGEMAFLESGPAFRVRRLDVRG